MAKLSKKERAEKRAAAHREMDGLVEFARRLATARTLCRGPLELATVEILHNALVKRIKKVRGVTD
jgi:hypothetical protein